MKNTIRQPKAGLHDEGEDRRDFPIRIPERPRRIGVACTTKARQGRCLRLRRFGDHNKVMAKFFKPSLLIRDGIGTNPFTRWTAIKRPGSTTVEQNLISDGNIHQFVDCLWHVDRQLASAIAFFNRIRHHAEFTEGYRSPIYLDAFCAEIELQFRSPENEGSLHSRLDVHCPSRLKKTTRKCPRQSMVPGSQQLRRPLRRSNQFPEPVPPSEIFL